MRYLPLTPDDRRAMLAKIGVPGVDALYRDVPKIGGRRPVRPSTCRTRRANWKSSAPCRGLRPKMSRRALGRSSAAQAPTKHHGALGGGSSDPALGIPHLLYALSARDRAGHLAISVRNVQTQVALLTGMKWRTLRFMIGSDRRPP